MAEGCRPHDLHRSPISLPETARLLKLHRQHQAELKMKNRKHYHDFGLVFAKEWEHMSRKWHTLGQPL
jgi:hypothetical protein